MIILLYCYNVGLGLFNLARATAGGYRPNGDSYFLSWWRSVDCLANACAGGDARETISSRAAKARADGREWGCVLCSLLAKITRTDHCALSLDSSVGSEAVIPDGE